MDCSISRIEIEKLSFLSIDKVGALHGQLVDTVESPAFGNDYQKSIRKVDAYLIDHVENGLVRVIRKSKTKAKPIKNDYHIPYGTW